MGCRLEAIQRCITSRAEGGTTGLTAQGLNPFCFPLSTVADQRVDMRICDPIVHTGVIGAGEPLGSNPFGRTAAAFLLTPGDDRGTRWGCVRRSRRLLAAGRAVIWGARSQQPLDGARDGGGMRQRMRATTPNPGQADQRCYDQQAKPTDVARHRQPRDTVFEFSGALSNGKEGGASCQVASRSSAELSTMEKGSTLLPASLRVRLAHFTSRETRI
jgi:hypothetical protein